MFVAEDLGNCQNYRSANHMKARVRDMFVLNVKIEKINGNEVPSADVDVN